MCDLVPPVNAIFMSSFLDYSYTAKDLLFLAGVYRNVFPVQTQIYVIIAAVLYIPFQLISLNSGHTTPKVTQWKPNSGLLVKKVHLWPKGCSFEFVWTLNMVPPARVLSIAAHHYDTYELNAEDPLALSRPGGCQQWKLIIFTLSSHFLGNKT